MKVELAIGDLAKYLEEYYQFELHNNKEVSIEELEIKIPTLTDSAIIKNFIKKFDLPMVKIDFDNGYSIKVARNHILQQHKKNIFAYELREGSCVDHSSGNIYVTSIEEIENQNCFDIGIDQPHLYHDSNGLIHHNTIMTAALSASVEAHGRSIVIVPNKSLVTQTERDYVNVGLDVGVFYGDRKELGRRHTICTWQSLNVLLKNTQSGDTEVTIGEFIEDVVCVIVDEAHGAKAEAMKSLLTGVMSHVPIRWGLTGTIPKEDFNRLALTCTLGPVIGRLTASELQDQGVLADCHVNIVQLVEHKEFANYQTELKYLLENSERLDYIAKMIEQIRKGGNTLILIDRVGAGQALVSRIQDAVFLSGATKNAERQEEYDEVATATDKVLVCTYGIAAVGINVPRIFNLVLIEPGKSFVRVIQSIGRGIRRASDKDHVEIWDITSSCKFAKRHLTQRKNFYREAKYPFDLERVNYI
jgi:hypothetical protein